MSNPRHNALMTVIVPMVIGEIVKTTGLDEKDVTARFYASRVYEELSDESRKLWHYSPVVLAAMYDEEANTGSITYPEEAC